MISFGWSAGDLATACVIIHHVIKAFDNAKGSKKQYRDSHAFLSGLYLVVKYLSDDEKASTLPEDARVQVTTISNAYVDLHAYILKHAGIGDEDRSRVKTVLSNISWSMHELNHKVQTMKQNSLNSIAIMETLVVMDLSKRISTLLESGDRQEQSLKTTCDVLEDVREQLSTLSQASDGYQTVLSDMKQMDDAQTDNIKAVEERLDEISKSQQTLQADLDKLIAHMQDQKAQSEDQGTAAQWQTLLDETNKDRIDTEKTKEDLRNTTNLIGGVSDITGGHRLRRTGEQVGGVSRVFDAFQPLSKGLGKFWGSPKEKAERPVSREPQQRAKERAYKLPPPVMTPPPPRRSVGLPASLPSSPPPARNMPPPISLPSGPPPRRIPPALPMRPSQPMPSTGLPRLGTMQSPKDKMPISTRSVVETGSLSTSPGTPGLSQYSSRSSGCPPALPPRPVIAGPIIRDDQSPLVVRKMAPPLLPRKYLTESAVREATSPKGEVLEAATSMSRETSQTSSTTTSSAYTSASSFDLRARRSTSFSSSNSSVSMPPQSPPKPIYLNELMINLKSRQSS